MAKGAIKGGGTWRENILELHEGIYTRIIQGSTWLLVCGCSGTCAVLWGRTSIVGWTSRESAGGGIVVRSVGSKFQS